jgi:glycine/D-amino acid oxidase-like deaminating enzyme
MNLSSYRCPPVRLARLFHRSRDLWKQRAAAKQDEIRYLRVKVRDLAASRDFWKQQALQARHARAASATEHSLGEP